jgi:uncharacterized protein YyaL (SSP411 family)
MTRLVIRLLGPFRDLLDGKPATYVCRDFVCQAPVTEVEAL